MIISYLLIFVCSESIPEYYIPDLLDLIGFGHRSFWLEVQNLFDAIPREDVMVTFDSLIESEMQHKLNKISETNVGIRPSAENTFKKLRVFCHDLFLHLISAVSPSSRFFSLRLPFFINNEYYITARPENQQDSRS
ncbi:MAG: hypothetical protein A2Z25_19875 [Planctomycetes bacterium RBG_16_55_9]|nr:MAG: hypothetical protein A2Z25_19875 [Planctomycetes bacterium RBG_16_55_9]